MEGAAVTATDGGERTPVRVVGSGLGRTGTLSLKHALEQLLGAPCYHMMECFAHPDHASRWHGAVRGETTDWPDLLSGYAATADWPGAACWKEMAAAFPDAIILHSERPADAWFASADRTIFEMFKSIEASAPPDDDWSQMIRAIFTERFTPDFLDRDAAMAAVDRWNADVRATADPGRLVIWQTGDGWEPICAALGLAVPEEPFPHVNSTEEFRRHAGFD